MRDQKKLLEILWHDGRCITRATEWWWKCSTIELDELSCVHGKHLNEDCAKCNENKEWDDEV